MHFRKLSVSLAAAAALSPAFAHAGSDTAALKACARAFATSIAAPGTQAPAFKLNYQQNHMSSAMSDYYAREYTFFMKAADPKTGAPLARATCSADTSGAVIALTATPLESAPALALSR
jgi:hypothetical protein